MSDSLQERDRQRNVRRQWAQTLSTEQLASLLFAMAEQPKRLEPNLKYALLYAAGARLRQLDEQTNDPAEPAPLILPVPEGAAEVWPHLFVYTTEAGDWPGAERVFWMHCDRCGTLAPHDSYTAAHRTAMDHWCPKAGQRSLELDD